MSSTGHAVSRSISRVVPLLAAALSVITVAARTDLPIPEFDSLRQRMQGPEVPVSVDFDAHAYRANVGPGYADFVIFLVVHGQNANRGTAFARTAYLRPLAGESRVSWRSQVPAAGQLDLEIVRLGAKNMQRIVATLSVEDRSVPVAVHVRRLPNGDLDMKAS